MRSARYIVSLLLVGGLLLFPGRALAAVLVVLGFMDDEVNEVLQQTLKANPHATVVAVSVANEQGELFGRPVATYLAGSPFLATNSFLSTVPAAGDSAGAQLARQLRAATGTPAFTDTIQRRTAPGPVRSRLKADSTSELTVVEFGPAKSSEQVIVVVRSPEMGRQPSLVQPYLDAILESANRLPQAAPEKGGIRLRGFGTSGGLQSGVAPGHVAPVAASVYVGLEMDPNVNSPKRFRGVVSVIAPGSRSGTRYFDRGYATRAEAEAAAQEYFIHADNAAPIMKRLAQIKRNGRPVSLTASFFGGPAMKERGDRLGLVSVAMEDAQVILAANSHRIPVEIQRLITDPPSIPTEAREQIARWSRSVHYQASDYVEAMLWGLRGTSLKELETHPALRAAARWSLFDDPAMSQYKKLVASIEVGGESFVLDPLFTEIAAEFLDEAAAGHLLSTTHDGLRSYQGIVNDKLLESLDADSLARLNVLMETKSAELAAMATNVLQRAAAGAPEAELRGLLEKILAKTMGLRIPDGPLKDAIAKSFEVRLAAESDPAVKATVQAKITLLKNNGRIRLLANDDVLQKVSPDQYNLAPWVVQNRWGGNLGRRLRYLGSGGIGEVAQDRLFYRSGLVTLTPKAANDFVRQQLADFLPPRDCKDSFRELP